MATMATSGHLRQILGSEVQQRNRLPSGNERVCSDAAISKRQSRYGVSVDDGEQDRPLELGRIVQSREPTNNVSFPAAREPQLDRGCIGADQGALDRPASLGATPQIGRVLSSSQHA
jgi:hypothetical protein